MTDSLRFRPTLIRKLPSLILIVQIIKKEYKPASNKNKNFFWLIFVNISVMKLLNVRQKTQDYILE
jgi:hypothetical protein